MKSILLVLGTRRYRDALLRAVAAVRAGKRASLHVVQLSGPAAGDGPAGRPLAGRGSGPGRHCDCRASAGWTAAARRAGIQLAANATARSATGVTPSVSRSAGPTP